jgi:hypothetical protein
MTQVKEMTTQIKLLVTHSFKRVSQAEKLFNLYGKIIDYPRKGAPHSGNLFKIILRQRDTGWRIAYLVVREKVIDRLEQHPDSWESFEPVRGQSLLFVARRRNVHDIRCFLLDKPVVLKKGIWHGIVTTGKEADVKITENAAVRCVYWKTGIRLPWKKPPTKRT